MFKIKKGDIVEVTKGKDKGKKGKVIAVYTGTQRLLVEGVNLAKKHKKRTQKDQQGGIISIEVPVSIANLSLVCKNCNRAVRVGVQLLKDNTKTRICRSCKEAI